MCSTYIFITYICIGMASPTATIDEPVNPTHPVLILLIIIGIGCGLTLIAILILMSCVLRLRIKRRQKLSECHVLLHKLAFLFVKNCDTLRTHSPKLGHQVQQPRHFTWQCTGDVDGRKNTSQIHVDMDRSMCSLLFSSTSTMDISKCVPHLVLSLSDPYSIYVWLVKSLITLAVS